MDSLAERVAWAIETIRDDKELNKGINDVELAKLLGTNTNTMAEYRKGRGILKGEVIEKLVRHYQFNPMWLHLGQGEPFPGARRKYKDVCGPEQEPCPEPNLPSEFVFIRQVRGKISAGGGLIPDNTIDLMAAFRKNWIKRKGGKPEDMSLIRVAGDSMEPTLLSGDLVLVDHSRNVITSQGGIYAISIDHEIMIKRVQVLHDQGKLRIISDNKQYPPQEVEAGKVAINGKVIWFAREMER